MKQRIALLLIFALFVTVLSGCRNQSSDKAVNVDVVGTADTAYNTETPNAAFGFSSQKIEIGYGTTVIIVTDTSEDGYGSGVTYALLSVPDTAEWNITGIKTANGEDAQNCTVDGHNAKFNYPGEYTLTVEAAYADKDAETASLFVSVIDNVPPVITTVGALEVLTGSDLQSVTDYPVTATDEIDGEVSITVDTSSVDTNTLGSYTATVTASDTSGNTSFAELTVNVVSAYTTTAYTYKDMSSTMYASADINVRDMPDLSGKKIGRLTAGQEVAVTGQCIETSWYRINYNGQVGYVKYDYLVSQKPTVTESPSANAPSTEPPATQAPDNSQSNTPPGLVSINNLQNKKSLKQKCTDEEFQKAYDAAIKIVQPLIGLSREKQLEGIASALREMLDSGKVQYSSNAPHYNDPYGYFVLGAASCAGCTRATGLCLNMLGISYEHINENQWSHQWCRVNINGTYWICDAYGLYCGPEPAPKEHPYF